MTQSKEVVIVGGGPAGLSAAIWCKRLGLDHLLLESRSGTGGQLPYIQNQIIDYPGILSNNGQELQQFFHKHLKELDCNFRLNTSVLSIDLVGNCLTVKGRNGEMEDLPYHYMIFATGSSPRRLNVPGESEMIKRGEVYWASKDSSYFRNKSVAVIGGGDRAFEGALILAETGAHVELIHRSDCFRARKEYVDQVLKHPNIRLHTHSWVQRIDGDDQVRGITITNYGGQVNYIPVEGVLIRIGVQPNSQLLQEVVDMDKDKYIIHNQIYQTSQRNIFAIGDVCTRPPYSSISSAVGQGMVAAKSISMFLT